MSNQAAGSSGLARSWIGSGNQLPIASHRLERNQKIA